MPIVMSPHFSALPGSGCGQGAQVSEDFFQSDQSWIRRGGTYKEHTTLLHPSQMDLMSAEGFYFPCQKEHNFSLIGKNSACQKTRAKAKFSKRLQEIYMKCSAGIRPRNAGARAHVRSGCRWSCCSVAIRQVSSCQQLVHFCTGKRWGG